MTPDPDDPLGVDPLIEARRRWDQQVAETRARWDRLYPTPSQPSTSAPPAAPAPPAPGGGRPQQLPPRRTQPPQQTPPVQQRPPAVPALAGWCEDRRPGVDLTEDDEVD